MQPVTDEQCEIKLPNAAEMIEIDEERAEKRTPPRRNPILAPAIAHADERRPFAVKRPFHSQLESELAPNIARDGNRAKLSARYRKERERTLRATVLTDERALPHRSRITVEIKRSASFIQANAKLH